METGSILIDLSSWYRDSLAPKIEMIQAAVEEKNKLSFTYYAPSGTSERLIEPYYLVFRWSSWYVYGWCVMRGDFRLFKLQRMDNLRIVQDHFEVREVPLPDLSNERIFPGNIKVKALFEPEVKWRLVEEFGVHCYEEQADGRLLFHADYTDKENLITWLMSFRDKVELVEPENLKKELCDALQSVLRKYKQQEDYTNEVSVDR